MHPLHYGCCGKSFLREKQKHLLGLSENDDVFQYVREHYMEIRERRRQNRDEGLQLSNELYLSCLLS